MGADIQRQGNALDKHGAGLELAPVEPKRPGLLARARKIPLADIAALGAAFASVPESMRTVTMAAEGLYRVVPQAGAIGLKAARKGSEAVVGSWKMADGTSKLANFVAAEGVSATVPFDPAILFMAMALVEISHKLDAIQEMQEEMFEYLKQKDDAERRGNLKTLEDVLEKYRFNWDNETYKTNKHILVQGIRKSAEADIIHLKQQVDQKLKKKGFVTLDSMTAEKAGDVLSILKDYQVAVYVYAFSSFLEVMLLENFDRGYLSSVADSVERHALDYRMLYTRAYDSLEGQSESTLQHHVLGGVSAASRALGKAIEGTPIGSHTSIDEALIEAGDRVGELQGDRKQSALNPLPSASRVDVRPFTESIKNLDMLHNEPSEVLVDGATIYVLPEGEELSV